MCGGSSPRQTEQVMIARPTACSQSPLDNPVERGHFFIFSQVARLDKAVLFLINLNSQLFKLFGVNVRRGVHH